MSKLLQVILTLFLILLFCIDIVDGDYNNPVAFKLVERDNHCYVNRYKIKIDETEPIRNHQPIEVYPIDCPDGYKTKIIAGMNIYKTNNDTYNLYVCFLTDIIKCYYLNDDGKFTAYKTFEDFDTKSIEDPQKLSIGKNNKNEDSFLVYAIDNSSAIFVGLHMDFDAKEKFQSYNSITNKWTDRREDYFTSTFGEYRIYQSEKNNIYLTSVMNLSSEKHMLRYIIQKIRYDYIADLDQVKFLPVVENKHFVGFKFFNYSKSYCMFQRFELQYDNTDENDWKNTPEEYPIDCFDGHTVHGSNMMKIEDKYHLYVCFYFPSTRLICQYLDENGKFTTDFNNTVSEFSGVKNPSQLRIGLNKESTVFILTDKDAKGVVYGVNNNTDEITVNSVYNSVTNEWLNQKHDVSTIIVFGRFAFIQMYAENSTFTVLLSDLSFERYYYEREKVETPFDLVCSLLEDSKSSIDLPDLGAKFEKLFPPLIIKHDNSNNSNYFEFILLHILLTVLSI